MGRYLFQEGSADMLMPQPEREPDAQAVLEDFASLPTASFAIPPPEMLPEIPIDTTPLKTLDLSQGITDKWFIDTTPLPSFPTDSFLATDAANEDTLPLAALELADEDTIPLPRATSYHMSMPDIIEEVASDTDPASYIPSLSELIDESSVDTTAPASYVMPTDEMLVNDSMVSPPIIFLGGITDIFESSAEIEEVEDAKADLAFAEEMELIPTITPVAESTAIYERMGDDFEFSTLFHTYSPSLHRYILNKTGSYDDADDIVQETFISVLKHWSELRTYDAKRIKNWLYRVAINKSSDLWRRIKRRLQLLAQQSEQHDTEHSYEHPSFIEGDEQQARYVYIAFKELSPRERECLLLHIDGFSHSEVAEMLNLKEKSVSGTISRAKKKFREVYLHLQTDERKA